MKIDGLLQGFKSTDPKTQELLIEVAEHAYLQGRRDQSEEMLHLACATEQRISKLIKKPITGSVVLRLPKHH